MALVGSNADKEYRLISKKQIKSYLSRTTFSLFNHMEPLFPIGIMDIMVKTIKNIREWYIQQKNPLTLFRILADRFCVALVSLGKVD